MRSSLFPRLSRRALRLGGSLFLLAPVHANDALDVLEGRRNAADVALPAVAGEDAGVEAEKPVFISPEWAPSPLDPIWSKAVLFEDPENPWVQQLAITGLFQWQGSWGEAETDGGGTTDLDGTRTRRARLGARLKAFRNTEIEAVAEFAGESDFRGLERLKSRTEILEGTHLSVGKMRPSFSIEYSTEPERMLTPERSFLVNMIAPASTLGIMLDGNHKGIEWGVGWFSSDHTSGFPGVEGNGFLLANLAYESVDDSGGSAIRTRWHADYIHNLDRGRSGSVPRIDVAGRRSANGNQLIASNPSFRHLFSTGVELEQERFAFAGDFMLANGDTNAWGLSLTPSYWALPGTLRIVGRYHYAGSDDPGALVGGMGTGTDPYFDNSTLFVGDEYHSFYLGANLHLRRDDVVILNGLEYITFKDQAGAGFDSEAWIWHTGARLSF